MKIANIQIQSSDQLSENLKKMESYLIRVRDAGAELAVFPEMAYYTSKRSGLASVLARFTELQSLFQNWAQKYQIAVIPGTLREPLPQNPEKFFNTLLCFDSQGNLAAKYQKIFRFQARLPHHTYDEAQFCEAGQQVITCQLEDFKLGFAICFDLRFPELFRSLRKQGAQVLIVPSAFTVPTGQAHWEVLLRSRAIENQCYLIASDQTLISGEGLGQYGHSLSIDPWGTVLGRENEAEGYHVVDVSAQRIEEVRSQINAWQSRNEALFPIS